VGVWNKGVKGLAFGTNSRQNYGQNALVTARTIRKGPMLEPLTVTVQAYPKFLPHPTIKVRLLSWLFGNVQVYTDTTNFSTPTKIYAFKCAKGGWILDYKHGFSPNEYMKCPTMLVNPKSRCPCV